MHTSRHMPPRWIKAAPSALYEPVLSEVCLLRKPLLPCTCTGFGVIYRAPDAAIRAVRSTSRGCIGDGSFLCFCGQRNGCICGAVHGTFGGCGLADSDGRKRTVPNKNGCREAKELREEMALARHLWEVYAKWIRRQGRSLRGVSRCW